MTKRELVTVLDVLTDMLDGWNDSAADGDRGRANDRLVLTLFDDGSGFLGLQGFQGEVRKLFEFGTTEECAEVIDIEFDDDSCLDDC